MKKLNAALFMLFLFGVAHSESILSKRYVVDKRLLGGADLSAMAQAKDELMTFKFRQPAQMYEYSELENGNTNYFTISGSTQTKFQNDIIQALKAKGIIQLMDTLELINENGRTVDSIHTLVYEPPDYRRDWTQVRKSTP